MARPSHSDDETVLVGGFRIRGRKAVEGLSGPFQFAASQGESAGMGVSCGQSCATRVVFPGGTGSQITLTPSGRVTILPEAVEATVGEASPGCPVDAPASPLRRDDLSVTFASLFQWNTHRRTALKR